MSTGKRMKCYQCGQYKKSNYMVKCRLGVTPTLCKHCKNSKANALEKPKYIRGLYFKPNTNLVIRVDAYGLKQRL